MVSLVLILFAQVAYAGELYICKYKNEAEIKVIPVHSKGEADLLVFVSDKKFDAKGKDEIWFYTDSKANASAKIFFVKNKGEADLKVFFVKNKGEAGWKKSNEFMGRLK